MEGMNPVYAERPVLFGRSRSLVGVMCSPADEARLENAPVVVFLNAGIIHRVGPNRLYVNLARALAGRGVASLRFDLGGIGDSPTSREQATVVEQVNRDIADAIEHAMADNPQNGVVLIGLCSGADNSFQTAAADPRIAGAVLLDPNTHRTRGFYIHRYARTLVDPEVWKLIVTGRHPLWVRLQRSLGILGRGDDADSSPFLAPTSLPPRTAVRADLGRLIERNCRLLYVFTAGLPNRYNHEKQFVRTFPDIQFGDCAKVMYFADSDHSFSNGACQSKLIAAVTGWLSTEPFGKARPPGHAVSPATAGDEEPAMDTGGGADRLRSAS
jgi:alpha/beta superfamily hydrolase